jgi:hypothetical protein
MHVQRDSNTLSCIHKVLYSHLHPDALYIDRVPLLKNLLIPNKESFSIKQPPCLISLKTIKIASSKTVDGWIDGCKGCFKDCIPQSKTLTIYNIKLKFSLMANFLKLKQDQLKQVSMTLQGRLVLVKIAKMWQKG